MHSDLPDFETLYAYLGHLVNKYFFIEGKRISALDYLFGNLNLNSYKNVLQNIDTVAS